MSLIDVTICPLVSKLFYPIFYSALYVSFAWLVHRLIDPGISCSAVRRVQLQSSQSLRQEVVQTTKTTGKFISLESCSFLLFLSSKQLPCPSFVSNLCYRCLAIFSTDSRKLPFFSAISYKEEIERKEERK